MPADVPQIEPVEIFAGDSIHFTKSLSNYSAADGWTLAYRLLSQKGLAAQTIAAVASGTGFEIQVASATTATWAEGEYWLIGYVTLLTERVQIYQGKFTVKPNPAIASHFDGRTYLQRILALLEEVIEQGVIREVIRYSYGGVTTEVQSMKDALDARDRIKALVVQEEAAASGTQRRIYTKFTTPI